MHSKTLGFQSTRTTARSVVCRGLKENVAKLPAIDGIARVRIPSLDWSVENKEGKKASVAIYSYLASTYGKLNKDAAQKGLELYDEVVADAKARPGKECQRGMRGLKCTGSGIAIPS